MAIGTARTGRTTADDTREGSITLPTADEDERVRSLIRAELDRKHAAKVARRTLELLTEAATEPSDTEPGYRIVDRNGETRYRQGAEPGSSLGAVPMTLSDFVEELRQRYPDLFNKPPPPEPPPIPVPAEPEQDTIAEVRAVSARFVEHQAARAKSLANNSAERGRAFATLASGKLEGWRARFGSLRLKSRVENVPDSTLPNTATASGTEPIHDASERLVAIQAARAHVGDRFKDGLRGVLDRAGNGTFGLRPILASLGVVILLGGIAAYLWQRPGTSEPSGTDSLVTQPQKAETQAQTPAQSPPADQQAKATPTEGMPEDGQDDSAQNPNALRGVPEIIDTATLRVAGKVVRLFGVEWVRGAQGQDLTRYLAGRSVSCLPAPGSTAHTCTVEGRDLSEVVLFNGGGRASSEAAPEHVAAEDHARTERLGVWKR